MKERPGVFKRSVIWTFVAILLIFLSARAYYALTDDFRLSNITYEMPYNESWTVPQLPSTEEEKLRKILSQKFIYLGKGAQAYAFESEDGNYVLKFFKFKHLKPSFFVEMLPSIGPLKNYKERQVVRKQRKLFGVFNSYKLAYDMNRNESGLIFIQLNNTGNPERYVTIRNKIGYEYSFDVQNFPFILQKKGQTFRQVLSQLLNQKQIDLAEQRIGQIFELYASEYRKGIYDHDHGVMQNLGFIGTEPFHLDVGKLTSENKMLKKNYAKQDAELVSAKINSWINKNYPEYSFRISQYIDKKMQLLFD